MRVLEGMSRLSVGVATCAAAPDLDEDGPLLMAALRAGGVDPHPAVWDDPMVNWGGFDVVLVRSTWDYPLRREAFLAWSRRCRRTANSREVLAWNTDKRYLRDPSRAAVPVVPTVFLPPGAHLEAPAYAFVVKPAVSGSAADTGRFPGGDPSAAVILVDRLHAQQRTAMVQPYLSGIDVEGETSMVFLGGVYSHAVRRQPLLAAPGIRQPVVVADVLDTIRPAEVTAAQRAVAEAAVEAVPGGRRALAYARVDIIPGQAGPVVLELEATDCFLFLASAADDARRRMVQHLLDNSGAGV